LLEDRWTLRNRDRRNEIDMPANKQKDIALAARQVSSKGCSSGS
jgi:hypothetical protein